jgi:hypothetical protein
MNWNGTRKNQTLGGIASCRESIATVKQRGAAIEAEWLLKQVDPEENKSALVSLVVPLTSWANSLPDNERETWLLWAMGHRAEYVRSWLGYAPDWTMVPAAVSDKRENLVRLAHKGRLPSAYLIPAEPRTPDDIGPITLDNGMQVDGIKLATVTYAMLNGEWYKVYYPKSPSRSAISRAIRLYLLGILVGRPIASTNELMMYEMVGIKSWMLYGTIENGIATHASDTLFHLLVEPGVLGD